jgi:uncharacterized membrane protein
MTLHRLVELAALGFEAVGTAVMVLGALLAFVPRATRSRTPRDIVEGYRERLGRAIVLGLEFLVAADIIKTITAEPTLKGVGTLAVIVLIRTGLSFALAVELEGRWPWQRSTERS